MTAATAAVHSVAAIATAGDADVLAVAAAAAALLIAAAHAVETAAACVVAAALAETQRVAG